MEGSVERYPFMFTAYTGSGDKTETGTLITLQFKVAENATAKDYDIVIKNLESYNYDEEEVIFNGVTSKVTVYESAPTLTGTLSVNDTEASQGETIEVPVVISNNPGIAVIGFDVEYDRNAMTLTGFTEGTIFARSEMEGSVERYPFMFTAYTGSGDKTETGTLITLQFKVADNATTGDYNVVVKNIESYNYNEDEVIFDGVTSKVTVTKPLLIGALSVDDTEGVQGETIEVPVVVSNNPGVAVIGFDVEYDRNAMTLTGFTEGTIFARSEMEGSVERYPFMFTAYTGSGDKTETGTLITLQFKVADNATTGDYNVVVKNIESYNYNEDEVIFDGVTSKVTVKESACVPEFTANISDTSLLENESLTLNVVAEGNGTLTYQWYKNDEAISGATSATYEITSVSLSDAGSYKVVVTNSLNGTSKTADSNVSVVTVLEIAKVPVIKTDLSATESVNEEATLTLNVEAEGNGTLTYQWYKDNAAISGATSAIYEIASVSLSDAGSYKVVVTNTLNGTSEEITSTECAVTVKEIAKAPVITTNLSATMEVNEGTTFEFTVEAEGNGELSYQWYRDGIIIVGAVTDSYSKDNATLNDAGRYTVVVTNTLNGTSKTATSNECVLTVNEIAKTPVITTDISATKSLKVSEKLTLTVVAEGNGTLTYQWYKDNAAISGATSATYEIASVKATDAGNYKVVVTNSLNGTSYEITSTVCAVTVTSDVKPGDVTGDGKVNRSDLLRLARYFAGNKTLVVNMDNSDVTGDGKVNRSDLLRLARYFAGAGVTLG